MRCWLARMNALGLAYIFGGHRLGHQELVCRGVGEQVLAGWIDVSALKVCREVRRESCLARPAEEESH